MAALALFLLAGPLATAAAPEDPPFIAPAAAPAATIQGSNRFPKATVTSNGASSDTMRSGSGRPARIASKSDISV